MTAEEQTVTRVEELTLRFLDGEADAAEREELAALVETDAVARQVHLRLIEVEVALRGGRPAQVAPQVLEEIARDRADRAVRGVMQQVSSMTPLTRGPRASRRRWPAVMLALASVAAVLAVVWGWHAIAPTTATAPTRPPRRPVAARPDFTRPRPAETVPGGEPTIVLAQDFEGRDRSEGVVDGRRVEGPCARGSELCLVGTGSEFDPASNTVTLERFNPPLFSYAPQQVLSFDYRVGADVSAMRIQLWSRDRHANFAVFLQGLVRLRWAHAQVRLQDLRGYGGKGALLPGDGISNVMLTAGKMGGDPFHVDNLRVLEYPEDASLPTTSVAIPLEP
jgi:hypothetical protein